MLLEITTQQMEEIQRRESVLLLEVQDLRENGLKLRTQIAALFARQQELADAVGNRDEVITSLEQENDALSETLEKRRKEMDELNRTNDVLRSTNSMLSARCNKLLEQLAEGNAKATVAAGPRYKSPTHGVVAMSTTTFLGRDGDDDIYIVIFGDKSGSLRRMGKNDEGWGREFVKNEIWCSSLSAQKVLEVKDKGVYYFLSLAKQRGLIPAESRFVLK
jgi:hypothetical protein